MTKNAKEKFYDKKASSPLPRQRGVLGFLWHKLKKFEKYRVDMAVQLLPKDSKKLLDVGCREGEGIVKASKRIKGNITGVDISAEALKLAKENVNKSGLEKRVNFAKADVDEGLSFSNNTFDSVMCLATLEHVFDPLFVMSEFRRVIKPGGTLVIEVPNLAFLPRRLLILLGKRPRTSWGYGWDGGHLQYFTMGDLCRLFEDYGFRPKVKTGSGILFSLRNIWPSLLFANLIVSGLKEKK